MRAPDQAAPRAAPCRSNAPLDRAATVCAGKGVLAVKHSAWFPEGFLQSVRDGSSAKTSTFRPANFAEEAQHECSATSGIEDTTASKSVSWDRPDKVTTEITGIGVVTAWATEPLDEEDLVDPADVAKVTEASVWLAKSDDPLRN